MWQRVRGPHEPSVARQGAGGVGVVLVAEAIEGGLRGPGFVRRDLGLSGAEELRKREARPRGLERRVRGGERVDGAFERLARFFAEGRLACDAIALCQTLNGLECCMGGSVCALDASGNACTCPALTTGRGTACCSSGQTCDAGACFP